MNLDNRKYVLYALVLITGVVYFIRLFYMQVIDQSWALRAAEIAEKKREVIPPRGIILDRYGKKIITNKIYFNLMMVEDKITSLDTTAFASLIGWTPEQVREQFYKIKTGEGFYKNKSTGIRQSNYRSNRAYPFVTELTLKEITIIAANLEKFPGFYEEPTSIRSYPIPSGANIFGYLNEAKQNEIERDDFYSPGMSIGRSGIEQYYEKFLRGKKGIKYVVTNASNNEVYPYANKKYDITASPAPNMTLGLDIELQEYGEKLMKNKRGCIVAIEPASGEILAMVSAPSYDPNLMVGRKNISKNYPALITDESLPLFPRPLQAEYPPGSIFKLIQSLICLQEGAISPETGFSCNKDLVNCHNHPSATSVSKAIQFSCNPYFYQAVRRVIQPRKTKNMHDDAWVGLNIWQKHMMSFGLGLKPGVDIDPSGQRPGLIPNGDYYDHFFGNKQWGFSSIQSISIGQGEVKLTPLQMANVAVILANRGWYFLPHFVKNLGGVDIDKTYRTKKYSSISEKHFGPVIEGMRRVVYEAGGTGSLARISNLTICGKTGTVQNGKNKKNHSVFIAFAPMNNPKIAIAVIVENVGAGGSFAAPIAGLIAEKYLNKKIEDPEKEAFIMGTVVTKDKKTKPR